MGENCGKAEIYDVLGGLKLSAQNNNVTGMKYLAECYENGVGTDIDLVKACEWYTKSKNYQYLAEMMTDSKKCELISQYIFQLQIKLTTLEDCVTELEYRPGGIGAESAQIDFENKANTL